MNTTPLLAVEHLGVHYPLRSTAAGWRSRTLAALDDVSLAIAPGGTLGIVGESGSGKSTLARVLLGFVRPYAGEVRWQGQVVDYRDTARLRALRRDVQVVFQDPVGSLDPRMTAADSVAEALDALGGVADAKTSRDRVARSFAEVGLAAELMDRYPHELSGGQCQRVAIARATISRPQLLICDEATSALDVSVQAQVLALLGELVVRHRMALLFISHNLAVVRGLCAEVAVFCRGRVMEQGTREAVFGNPQHPYTRELLAAVPEPDPRRYPRRALTRPAADLSR
jgi:ABC-type glutathione transport system ATPase component